MTVNAAALQTLQQYRMSNLARFAGITRAEAHSIGRAGLLEDPAIVAKLRESMSDADFTAAFRGTDVGTQLNAVA